MVRAWGLVGVGGGIPCACAAVAEVPRDVVVPVVQPHLKVNAEGRTVGIVFGNVGGIHVVDVHGTAEVDGAGSHVVGVGGHVAEAIYVGHEAAVALEGVGGVADVEPCVGVVGVACQRVELIADAVAVQCHRTDIVGGGDDVHVLPEGAGVGIVVGSEGDFPDVLFNGGDIDHGGVAAATAAALPRKVKVANGRSGGLNVAGSLR